MINVRSNTDGLASGYQIMEVTAGGPPVLETGGNLLIGTITLPYSEPLLLTPAPPESSATWSEKEGERLHNRLALEMTETPLFRQLVERGLVDLEQGRYKGLGEAKRKSGVL